MDGILLVDKPSGLTSHDVVVKVRNLLRHQVFSERTNLKTKNYKLTTPKVGHTGTLDPAATGLLVLVLGSYTKRAGEFSKLDKTYEVEIKLGATSTTADSEGEIVQKNTRKPRQTEVKQVLNTFVGQISQTPPAFSAIKVGGQRAYKLARAGKQVKMEPRKVTIYSIKNVQYDYPKLACVTEVSSGTYIRSLAVDIGEKLGTGAYLSALRRTQVDKFDIKGALKVADLTVVNIQNNLQN